MTLKSLHEQLRNLGISGDRYYLDSLVKQYGSRENAFNAVQNSANQALKNGRLTPNAQGILPSGSAGNIIKVGGYDVRLIGGHVVDGRVIISSFSRRGL